MTRAGLGFILFLLAGAGHAGAQTIGYAEAIDLLAANCGKDIAAYCARENLGGGRVQRCLVQNQDKVSARCKAASAEVGALLQKRAAARQAVLRVCEADIGRLCSGVQPGDVKSGGLLIISNGKQANAGTLARRCGCCKSATCVEGIG